MPAPIFRNGFEKGLNSDVDKDYVNNSQYTNAHNLELVGDGKFFALKNVRGTTNVQNVVSAADSEVLGVFENQYLIGGVSKKCLTIFTAKSTATRNFNIFAYDTEADVLYQLFTEEPSADYFTSDRVVDAVRYAENGVDHLYFTDFYNEMRVIRCEIPDPYVANFLLPGTISLQRRGALGIMTPVIEAGGSLLSGTYQFAYRMVDPVNKRFSRWSTPTLPVHVYSAANSDDPVYSDIGLITDFKINVTLTFTDVELLEFDYFQLAVIENVYPTVNLTASLLPIQHVNVGFGVGFDYTSNQRVGTTTIDEIVTDLASIKTVKTLNVKENRLTGGNVVYHPMDFDNGDPTVTGGSVAVRVNASSKDLFNDHSEASLYKGYFRDEVYRFGVVYYDKYGNKSPVKVIDLSSITDNQIAGTYGLDMRFPARSTSNTYSLLHDDGRVKSIGLNITGLTNHPSWAVAFEIVVAKRIKSILSQTPVIPTVYVDGTGAIDNYPSLATTDSAATQVEYPDAQPMGVTKIFMPKNLFWPEWRSILRGTEESGTGQDMVRRGEVKLYRGTLSDGGSPLVMIFPQGYMYGVEGDFILSGAEKLRTVDYCTLKAYVSDYTSSGVTGNTGNTNTVGVFHALDDGDYYFDSGWTAKTVDENDYQISESKSFLNFGQPAVVGGKSVMDYEKLLTTGFPYGLSPSIHKGVVVDAAAGTAQGHDPMGRRELTFANAGDMNLVANGGFLFGSAGPVYETDLTNEYISQYAGYTNNSSYVQALSIANIVNQYNDDRYGDAETQHEFISTGARYVFADSEITLLLGGTPVPKDVSNIFGGDCFIGPHTFKITDGHYSVVNQNKNHATPAPETYDDLLDNWGGKIFENTDAGIICLPYGVEGSAQFVTVILESEHNGSVMAQDILDNITADLNVNGMPLVGPKGGSLTVRSPLTYRYNLNLSRQNDQKIYLPRPAFNFERSEFPSRVVYSDQKVYNTDLFGFDVFRVLNYVDLEEKYGPITKLVTETDNLFAIQTRGITLLPAGEVQMQTTDGGSLSVGTGDFIGRPIVINDKRGSQHLRGIVETGDEVFIPDNLNKAVYSLSNKNFKIISDSGQASEFRSKFGSTIEEKHLVGLYDNVKKEYWIASSNPESGNFCLIYNTGIESWISNYEFDTNNRLQGGVYTNQKLYILGAGSDASSNIAVYEMYTGNYNNLMGSTVTPRVSFVVNPEAGISKTFTNMAFIATERLATIDFGIERETSLGAVAVSGTILDTVNIRYEGNYRLKLPRDADGGRLRGLRLQATVKWLTTNVTSSLTAVFTKYRFSSRTPF